MQRRSSKMNDFTRGYYFALAGAFGGLTGWLVATILTFILGTSMPFVKLGIYGALAGFCPGMAVAMTDVLVSRRRKIPYIGLALVPIIGTVIGIAGVLIIQMMFVRIQAHITPTWEPLLFSFCWVLFGGLIGSSSFAIRGGELWKNILGGMAGGFVAGWAIGGAGEVGLMRIPIIEQAVFAASLLAMGAVTGIGAALVTRTIYRAWIKVLDGKSAGREFDVTKYIDPRLGRRRSGIIGSQERSANVYLPNDKAVLPLHAEIKFANGGPALNVHPEAIGGLTLVNDQHAIQRNLKDGDRIQIGETQLLYRQEYK